MEGNLLKLKSILSKPPAFRSSEDLKEIASYICKIKFFSELKEDKQVFNDCCMYITYEYFPENRYVFHMGDIGDKFYIMIEGEAAVLVPGKPDEPPGLKEVFVYHSGSNFGELALMEKKPRSATILTKTPCHFAVLDKTNYQRILAGRMKRKRLDLVDFLQKQLLFKNLTKGSLIKLSYCFEEKIYKKDHVLLHEGNVINHLFLIREGEITISKRLFLKKVDFEITNKYKEQLNKRFSQRAEISILGPGEFLGLYDLQAGLYSTTAICASLKVNVLKITLADFKKRINNQECTNFIRQRSKLTEAIHTESINSIAKTIQDKESSSFRKISVKIDKNMKSESISPRAIESRNTSPIFFPTQEVALITRRRINADIITATKYEVKIASNLRLRCSSHLRFKKPCNTATHIETTYDDIKVNKSCVMIAIGHETEESKMTSAKVISRLEPFGRKKLIIRRKPSEFVNIHTQQSRLNKNSLVPANQSFRLLRKSPPKDLINS